MTKKQYQNATGIFSTQLAIGSFLVGTLLLILELLFPNGQLLEFGLIYVIIAILFNLMVLIYLIYLCFTQKNHQEYYTIKILILLANIPIAIVYMKIISETLQ
ncbi:hypothetical protein OX283_009125 [Flavobacterium sp. SUN052]|uniref:hypothetical protein n=1 Tax=Flavobacterium sp. SUN052 TaxID=3002441 RepID=UPI00237E6FC1|nr:hypothetical protein [Flavobacterium sp. SUN052]MEC4004815.1 hypothetical protein [Flavobacterium sp. SUN052]